MFLPIIKEEVRKRKGGEIKEKMEKKKASMIWIAVVLVLIGAVSAVDATTVSVEPATQVIIPGDSFSVDVYVTNVTNMAADGAILHFDPTAMQATGITAGVIDTFPIEQIDNVTGTVTFGYALMTGSYTGSGPLATIDFDTNASAECWFDLTLTDVELYDSDVQLIPTGVVNGTVGLDNTPPEVNITYPYEDEWFDSEEVWLIFCAYDEKDDVLNYTVYVDGEEKTNGTIISDDCEEVNLGVLPDCDRVINVTVTDDVELTGSDEVTIHVDLYPPEVEILWPVTCTWYDSEPVIVEFHPWDNKAVVLNYTVYVDGVPAADGVAPECENTTVDLGILEECDHVINVTVEDYVGKTGSDEVTIHVDLTPPIVDIITPINRNYSSKCVRLNFTAEDPGPCPSGIAEVYYVLDGGAPVSIVGNVTVSPLGDGDHYITVTVVDVVDKEDNETVNFYVCVGDIDFSGKVYLSDLLLLAQAYGSRPGDGNWNPDADLSCDDWVYTADLLLLAQNYEKYCPAV